MGSTKTFLTFLKSSTIFHKSVHGLSGFLSDCPLVEVVSFSTFALHQVICFYGWLLRGRLQNGLRPVKKLRLLRKRIVNRKVAQEHDYKFTHHQIPSNEEAKFRAPLPAKGERGRQNLHRPTPFTGPKIVSQGFSYRRSLLTDSGKENRHFSSLDQRQNF